MQHSLAVDPVRRYQEVTEIKANGATYTPDELAAFVADRIAGRFEFKDRERITILDPAVGDGALILALLASVRKRSSAIIEVIAFDTDTLALDEARRRIRDSYPDVLLTFAKRDFLQFVLEHENDCGAPSLFSKPASPKFDLIIANPPYVRTQIMGAEQAQHLASAFDLTGRVDLYQAFLLAMAQVLSPQGAAGFIVSNRFMTTKGGGSLRAALRTKLSLQEIWDMGDTKLFNAAVLPAVIIATGIAGEVIEAPSFSSIYEVEDAPVSCVSEPIAEHRLSWARRAAPDSPA